MPTTYENAYEELSGALIAGVVGLGASLSLPGNVDPALRFTDVEKGEIPKAVFCRFTMNPVLERQSTFRGADGTQRYTVTGVFFVQCFTPRALEKSAEFTRALSVAVRGLYRAKHLGGCVWARNVRITRLDPENNFTRANVVGEYEYDEIG